MLVQSHVSKWMKHLTLGSDRGRGFFHNYVRSSKQYSSKSNGASISCSHGTDTYLFVPLSTIVDAKVIYSVAPAMGHNQVLFCCVVCV